jgi:hypothetical protein
MARKRTRGVRRPEKQWIEIIRRFGLSGLGTREFCNREGVPLSTFQRWQKRLHASGGGTAQFLEIVAPASPHSAPCR